MAHSIQDQITKQVWASLQAFGRDESGAAAVEYVVLSAVILATGFLAFSAVAATVQAPLARIHSVLGSKVTSGGAAEPFEVGQTGKRNSVKHTVMGKRMQNGRSAAKANSGGKARATDRPGSARLEGTRLCG